MHPIERAQLELVSSWPVGATVSEAIALSLGIDEPELEELIGRQLMDADKHVPEFAREMRSTRRAAVGCGLIAGVTFAVAALRDAGMISEADS